MSLLDYLDNPAVQGLLAAGFGGLTSRTVAGGIGRGGLLGLTAYNNAQNGINERAQQAKKNQLFDLQLGQAKRQDTQAQELDALRKRFTLNPAQSAMQAGAAAGSVGPTVQNAQGIEGAAPSFDYSGYADAIAPYDVGQSLQIKSALQKSTPAPIAVGEGTTLVDPRTLKPVFSQPKTAAPTDLSRMIGEMNNLPEGSPLRGIYQAAINKTTTHAPGTSVSVNTGQKGIDNELKLRGDFRGEPVYKAHQEMQSAYSQIKQALSAVTPAGDLAAATKIMKLLDPGSVVRESELGMAMQATGLMDRLSNYANLTMSGQKLTPNQRKEFQQLADALYGESVKQFNGKRGEYAGMAKDYGLNEGRVAGSAAAEPAPSKVAPKRYNPTTGRIE